MTHVKRYMKPARLSSRLRRAAIALGLSLALAAAGDASAQGRAPWLGIAMTPVPGGGVLVGHVVGGSPAEKAGLHDGDRVLRIDGAPVASPGELQRVVAHHAVGDSVAVVVQRAGAEQTIRVTLEARPSPDEQLRMEHVGKFARPWTGLERVSGALPKNIDALRGRVVVVDFWATWCGPCRLTAPVLSGWQAKFGAQGLSIVGITTDDADDVAAFAARHDMRFALASDPRGETSRAYGIGALPTQFIIDKRGVVRDIAVGYDPGRETQLETLITQLLAEPAPSPAPPPAP